MVTKKVLQADDIQEINERVGEAAEENEVAKKITDTVTLHSGYTVRVIPIPDGLFTKIAKKFPTPKPPMIERVDGSQTFLEPNLEDPDYLDAFTDNRMIIAESMSRAEALKGVEVVSVPEGAFGFLEDKEWMEELDAIGTPIPVDSSRSARYIEWFLYRVAPTWEDRGMIQDVRMTLNQVSEEDIEAAEATFRNND